MDSIILFLALILTFALLDMWFSDYKDKNDKFKETRSLTAIFACALWASFHFFTH